MPCYNEVHSILVDYDNTSVINTNIWIKIWTLLKSVKDGPININAALIITIITIFKWTSDHTAPGRTSPCIDGLTNHVFGVYLIFIMTEYCSYSFSDEFYVQVTEIKCEISPNAFHSCIHPIASSFQTLSHRLGLDFTLFHFHQIHQHDKPCVCIM